MAMDPVTTFSLAAGVLQVTSTGFEVLSKCRELWKNGSLSQHRDTEDVANRLCIVSDQRYYAINKTDCP